MLRAVLLFTLIGACAHTHPSRWEDASGRYTTCVCEGKERNRNHYQLD